MIINGPQNIYGPIQQPDSQGNITRPDISRTPKPELAPTASDQEQQAKLQVQNQVDISIKDTKDLSRFYNAYRSYAHQLSATDTLVDRVTSGANSVNKIFA